MPVRATVEESPINMKKTTFYVTLVIMTVSTLLKLC